MWRRRRWMARRTSRRSPSRCSPPGWRAAGGATRARPGMCPPAHPGGQVRADRWRRGTGFSSRTWRTGAAPSSRRSCTPRSGGAAWDGNSSRTRPGGPPTTAGRSWTASRCGGRLARRSPAGSARNPASPTRGATSTCARSRSAVRPAARGGRRARGRSHHVCCQSGSMTTVRYGAASLPLAARYSLPVTNLHPDSIPGTCRILAPGLERSHGPESGRRQLTASGDRHDRNPVPASAAPARCRRAIDGRAENRAPRPPQRSR